MLLYGQHGYTGTLVSHVIKSMLPFLSSEVHIMAILPVLLTSVLTSLGSWPAKKSGFMW